MTFTDAISARILELLEIKNTNVSKLAIKAGINESTIRSVLSNSTKCPKVTTIRFICIGFDMSISEFFNSEIFKEDNLRDE